MKRIHPTAQIAPEAVLPDDIEIGPFTIVYANVRIGEGARIAGHCEIGYPSALSSGEPLVLGEGALIRSHSIFYEGSSFGPRLVTGHHVTVRERTQAGVATQIGTLSDIQGHCVIGDYVRTHSNVHICQKATVEDFVWIFPYTVLTNDPHPPSVLLRGPTVKKFAIIATHVTVLPGLTVGEGALVGAGSVVVRDVSPRRIAAGNPATDRGPIEIIKLRDGSGVSAYPWIRHFHKGYPPDVIAEWKKLSEQGQSEDSQS